MKNYEKLPANMLPTEKLIEKLTNELNGLSGDEIPESMLDDIGKIPKISEQLPLKFDTGFALKKFDTACPDCSNIIPEDNFRGFITRPIPAVGELKAFVKCDSCYSVFASHIRIRSDDDGERIEINDTKGWVIVDIPGPPWYLVAFHYIMNAIKGFFWK